MRKAHLVIIFPLGILLGLSEPAYSWGNKITHPALTHKAITASAADDYLRTQLNLRDGLAEELEWVFPLPIKQRLDKGNAEPEETTRTVLEWVKAGSIIEDEDGNWRLLSLWSSGPTNVKYR